MVRPNRDIGVAVGMHYNQVAVWRGRYAEFGLAGLDDGERPGRRRFMATTTCCCWSKQ